MKNNITIINGSARNKGNTDQLIASLIKGIDRNTLNVNQHTLRNKTISSCTGCYLCYKKKYCSVKDDMQQIHKELQESDLIILVSPMYWWGVTGLMKTFIDRLYLYYHKNNAGLIAGKKLYVMIPMHVNPEEHGQRYYESEIEPVELALKHTFRRLKMELLEIVLFPGLNEKGALKQRQEHIEHALELGKSFKAIL